MPSQDKVVIVGGGIAGMTVAHTLAQAGAPFRLIERSPDVGGVIETVQVGSYRMEMGPFSYLPKATVLPELIRDWGLEGEIQEASTEIARNRYVLKGDSLHRVPTGAGDLFRTRLLSWKEKLRLLIEPLAKGPPPDEESVADFVRRRAGSGVLNNFIQPFVSGVVAGNVEELSMAALFPLFPALEREHGSLLKALRARAAAGMLHRPTLFSLNGGMQRLPRAFIQRYPAQVDLELEVTSLQPCSGGWEVYCRGKFNNNEKITAARVVLATPAGVAARLLKAAAPAAATQLSSITYAPIILMHTVFRKSQLSQPLAGFGFLATRDSAPPILGSIWASSIFADRAPADELMLTWFAGGSLYPEAMNYSDDRLRQSVESLAARSLGIVGPCRRWWIRRIPSAIPQYHIGHLLKLKQINEELNTLGNLRLVGSYCAGVSLDDTAKHARAVAKDIISAMGVTPVL